MKAGDRHLLNCCKQKTIFICILLVLLLVTISQNRIQAQEASPIHIKMIVYDINTQRSPERTILFTLINDEGDEHNFYSKKGGGEFEVEILEKYIGTRIRLEWTDGSAKKFKYINTLENEDDQIKIELAHNVLPKNYISKISVQFEKAHYGYLTNYPITVVYTNLSNELIEEKIWTDDEGKLRFTLTDQKASETAVSLLINHKCCEVSSPRLTAGNYQIIGVQLTNVIGPLVLEAFPNTVYLNQNPRVEIRIYKKNSPRPVGVNGRWELKMESSRPVWQKRLNFSTQRGSASLDPGVVEITYNDPAGSADDTDRNKPVELAFREVDRNLYDRVFVYLSDEESETFPIAGNIYAKYGGVPSEPIILKLIGKDNIHLPVEIEMKETGSFQGKIPKEFMREKVSLLLESKFFELDIDSQSIDFNERKKAYIIKVNQAGVFDPDSE